MLPSCMHRSEGGGRRAPQSAGATSRLPRACTKHRRLSYQMHSSVKLCKLMQIGLGLAEQKSVSSLDALTGPKVGQGTGDGRLASKLQRSDLHLTDRHPAFLISFCPQVAQNCQSLGTLTILTMLKLRSATGLSELETLQGAWVHYLFAHRWLPARCSRSADRLCCETAWKRVSNNQAEWRKGFCTFFPTRTLKGNSCGPPKQC